MMFCTPNLKIMQNESAHQSTQMQLLKIDVCRKENAQFCETDICTPTIS